MLHKAVARAGFSPLDGWGAGSCPHDRGHCQAHVGTVADAGWTPVGHASELTGHAECARVRTGAAEHPPPLGCKVVRRKAPRGAVGGGRGTMRVFVSEAEVGPGRHWLWCERKTLQMYARVRISFMHEFHLTGLRQTLICGKFRVGCGSKCSMVLLEPFQSRRTASETCSMSFARTPCQKNKGSPCSASVSRRSMPEGARFCRTGSVPWHVTIPGVTEHPPPRAPRASTLPSPHYN